MASLASVREDLLISCYENIIDDVEFALLFDANASRLIFPHAKFERFDNDAWDESECRRCLELIHHLIITGSRMFISCLRVHLRSKYQLFEK